SRPVTRARLVAERWSCKTIVMESFTQRTHPELIPTASLPSRLARRVRSARRAVAAAVTAVTTAMPKPIMVKQSRKETARLAVCFIHVHVVHRIRIVHAWTLLDAHRHLCDRRRVVLARPVLDLMLLQSGRHTQRNVRRAGQANWRAGNRHAPRRA